MFIRPATDADVPHIEQIVNEAYTPYISRIGRAPAPMTVDYHRLVSATSILVEDSAILGVMVTVVEPDQIIRPISGA